mgnify:CR=1 FL=1|tara:strand:- start:146 stop:859 length:714 start_codon:yes stop_codon:yes gene_type:complete
MTLPKLHISKGSFKLEKIDNISTNTLTNNYCIKQNKKDNIICKSCYSFKGLNFRKSMIPLLQNNSDLLSKNIIDENFLPIIYNIYFRFNSHGELINETHLINLINIVNKNKHCNFALWTKRNDIIKKYFDNNVKPSNLILIYSNPKLNKPMNKPPQYFDKTFNNVIKLSFKDYFKKYTMFIDKKDIDKKFKSNIKKQYDTYKNDFNKNNKVNCYEKCIDCLKCYTHNNITTIIEKAK